MKASKKKVLVEMEKLPQETFVKSIQYRDSGDGGEETFKDDAHLQV